MSSSLILALLQAEEVSKMCKLEVWLMFSGVVLLFHDSKMNV